jgi:hypothetical protein
LLVVVALMWSLRGVERTAPADTVLEPALAT